MNTSLRTKRLSLRILLSAALLAVAAEARGIEFTSIFTGGGDGVSWSDPSNWYLPFVPDGGPSVDYNVIIDNDAGRVSNVQLDMSVDILRLTIDAGDSLTILGEYSLDLGTQWDYGPINNAGTLGLSGTSFGAAILRIGDYPAQLTGGGTLLLSDSPLNEIYQFPSYYSFTNVDNVIRGAGCLYLPLRNQCTVRATGANPLIIDPVSYSGGVPHDVVNTGTMQADGGGTLVLRYGQFDNAAGLIQAQAGSVVQVKDAEVVGGTLATAGDGAICSAPYSYASMLTNVTNLGNIRAVSNACLALSGTIVNNGQISVAGDASLALLGINYDVTLIGGGNVVLLDNANSAITSNTPNPSNGRLINEDNTIFGGGMIGYTSSGFNPLHFTNRSLVQATGTNPLIIRAVWVNQATMEALGGSVLKIAAEGINDSGAVIRAQNGAEIALAGRINGGRVVTLGTGLARADGGGYANLVLEAYTLVPNGKHLQLAGTIDNRQTIEMTAGANLTYIDIVSDVTLDGGGLIALSNSANNQIAGVGSATLLNQNNTIRGAGTIDSRLVNRSLIEGVYSTPLIVQAEPDSSNSDTIVARGGGALTFQNTGSTLKPFDNTGGQIVFEPSSTGRLSDSYIRYGAIRVQSLAQLVMEDYNSLNYVQFDNLSGGLTTVYDHTSIMSDTFANHAGATIRVMGDGTLFLGSFAQPLDNAGLVELRPDGTLAVGTVTLSGGGEIVLSSLQTLQSKIDVHYGNWLTNEDNTIRGSGMICNDKGGLVNRGLILADSGLLTLDPGVDPDVDISVVNQATMEADGGTLLLSDGKFDNQAGTIHAAAGSVVQLNRAEVVGGSLISIGNGYFQAVSENSLADLRIEGRLVVADRGIVHLKGTIENAGNVALQTYTAPPSSTKLVIDGDVTLAGGGSVSIGDTAHGRIVSQYGMYQLTNEDNTICGSGTINGDELGWYSFRLTNRGTIRATYTTDLIVDSKNCPTTNEGLMIAASGGRLRLRWGSIDNAGGVIEAENNGLVRLQGVAIQGGTLLSTGTGRLEVADEPSTLANLTSRATVRVPDQRELTLRGAIENAGLLALDGNHMTTILHVNGDVTLTGGGAVELSDSTVNRIIGNSVSARLINEDNTIRGAGYLGSAAMYLVNRGTIEANGTMWLRIDLTGGDGMTNEGTMRASGPGGMILADGAFTNAATVEILDGSKITCSGDYTQTAGLTDLGGNCELAAGPGRTVSVQGGLMVGEGNVTGLLDVDADGTLSPGHSFGRIDVIGDAVLHGTYRVELGGTDPALFDLLAVDGIATVGGIIEIVLRNEFEPSLGDSFDVVLADGVFNDCPTLSYDPLPVGWFEGAVAKRPDGAWAYRLTVVPEPDVLCLLAVFGLAVLARGAVKQGA